MTLGEKLKEARKQAGLSQEQLAEQLSISRSAIAKWENGLGHPDVENLRELAQLFNLSMDTLTDDTLSLGEAATRNPNTARCSKSCQGCTHREVLDCPGCRNIDPHGIDGCAIARCCQGKRFNTCHECICQDTCSTLRSRDYIPSKRLTALNTHKAQQKILTDRSAAHISWLANTYPTMYKWMPLLFGAVLLPIGANLLAQISAIEKPATVLGALLTGVYGLLMLQLSSIHPNYKKAGILFLATTLVAIVSVFYPDVAQAKIALKEAMSAGGSQANSSIQVDQTLSQALREYEIAKMISAVILSIQAALQLGAFFFEYHAHADVLAPFHKKMSTEWLQLWKFELIFSGGSLASSLGMVIAPFFAGILVTAALILGLGSGVIHIMRYIALFRMSKYFRNTTAEEMIRSADFTAPIPS